MKQIKTWFAPLWRRCYAAFLLASLAVCLWNWAADGVLGLLGKLPYAQIPLAECELADLEPGEDGLLTVTGGDPQLLLPSQKGGLVRRVRLRMEASAAPGEMDLYYTHGENAGFSPRKRAFGAQQRDGSYLYTLPRRGVWALRIDPGNTIGVRLNIQGIELNPPRSGWSYFRPGWAWILAFAVLPGLAAPVLEWLGGGLRRFGLARKARRG